MERKRLTITLKKSLLGKIDGFIDGTKIRNRSHAIEYLINQSLIPRVKQAVVLAGGKGIRMRPFTFEMPKGLLPVGGKPILEHIVEMLRNYEIRNIIFSIGHLGEKIKEYFTDGKKFGVKITYIAEDKPAGTGGALMLTKKDITANTFLVIHGDILIDIDLFDLINFHKEQESLATMAITSVIDPSSFGEVVLHGTKVIRFIEKPKKGKHTSQLVSCGLYVFEREIFNFLPPKGSSLLEEIFPRIVAKRKLAGFLFGGKWVDVGSLSSYEKAIRLWGKK